MKATTDPPIRLSQNHCCACQAASGGVCHHIDGPWLCVIHAAEPPRPTFMERVGTAKQACPARVQGVLGFASPTWIPCSLLRGHTGAHRYSIEWTDT